MFVKIMEMLKVMANSPKIQKMLRQFSEVYKDS